MLHDEGRQMSDVYTRTYVVRKVPITISIIPRIITFGSGFMSVGNFIRLAHFLPNSGPYHSQPKKKLATTATRTASQFRWNCGCMAPPCKKSTRLLPLRLEYGAGGRRGEGLDQRLCRRPVLRAHADAGLGDCV